MMPALPPRVHLISDRALRPDLAAHVAAALRGMPPGTVAVHLRERGLAARDLLGLARDLQAVAGAAGQELIVNDRIDVAMAASAAGVHLPSLGVGAADARRLLGPAARIGVSCHSLEDVRRARDGGADYATFGPIHDTPSKRAHGSPVGLRALAEAAALGLPLVGLGGVDGSNGAEVVAAGAWGVAAIRAWMAADDPGRAVRALLAAVEQGRRDGTWARSPPRART